jgi:hypothetical protein
MSKRGRKSRFNLALAEKIYFLAKKGMTDAEISYTVGIDEATLNRWKESKTFYNSLQKNKEDVDDRVEKALLKKALGYKYTEKTQEKVQTGTVQEGSNKGEPIYKTNYKVIEKEAVPSDSACQFWLKNRRGSKWRDRSIDITQNNNTLIGSVNVDQTVNLIKNEYGEKSEQIADRIAETLGIPLASSIAEVV